MFSSKRIKLFLAVVLAASSLMFVIAAFTLEGVNAESKASQPTLKSKILRRNDQSKIKLTGAELAELRSQASPQEEREFKDEIPKHVPIKFKLKAEKEKKFKDLGNPGWYRDFELEVTNTSDKPIYFLELWLEYPEIDAWPGVRLMVPLQYGRMNFIYQETRPVPTDVPIQPGETYVFTIPESDRKGWEAHKRRDNIPDPKKTLLTFVHLSFGDGTGYATSGAKPFPFRRQGSSLAPFCRGGPSTIVAQSGSIKPRSNRNATDKWFFAMTAMNSGGHFSVVEGDYSVLKDSSVTTDSCCGSGCYFMKPAMDSCACGDSPGNSYPACTDPQGTCGTPQERGHWCEDYGVYCPEYRISICVSDPPPPPSPAAPSPTLSPTPTAEPSPLISPCPSPRPISPCNPGWTAIWLPSCIWECLTPQPSGGGATYRGEYYADYGFYYGYYAYYDECTVYVWVTYVSYDGGETWEETGEVEYAGCW